ncbi:MAG: hypothetical protein PHN47_08455 [Clostridia bacterium]|nr:hypothetical protein [Clostridia bacterium]
MVAEVSISQLSSLKSATSIKVVAGVVSEIAGKKIEELSKADIIKTLVSAFNNRDAPKNLAGNGNLQLYMRDNLRLGNFEFGDTKGVATALAQQIDDAFIIKGEVAGSSSATGSKFEQVVLNATDNNAVADFGHLIRDNGQRVWDSIK